jgi:hypothetical protein
MSVMDLKWVESGINMRDVYAKYTWAKSVIENQAAEGEGIVSSSLAYIE